MWGKRDCHPRSGAYAGWAVGGGGDGSNLLCSDTYPANVHTWMLYGPIDLTDATQASLDFYLWGKSEGGTETECPYDYLFVGGSSDGSDFTGGQLCGDWTAGEATNQYYTLTLDLTDWLGEDLVWLGWIFHSDSDTEDIGFFIDDISLNVEAGPDPTATPESPRVTPEPLPPELHRWDWQHGAVRIYDVGFKDASNGWGVGRDGIILWTIDGGVSWQAQESGDGQDLREVQFVDADNGWALGSNTLLRTIDGGVTWEVITRTLPTNRGIISFVDEYHGWLAQSDGLLRTLDGGRTWTKQSAGIPAPIRDVQFIDVNRGFLVCKGYDSMDNSHILITSDGGQSWTEANCADEFLACADFSHMYGLHFPTANFGVAVGGFVNPNIFYTQDGGVNWYAVETSITFMELVDVFFVDTQHGWAWGDGEIIRTADGGQTWFELGSLSVNDLQFVTSQQGYLARNYGIYYTDDGGNSWDRSTMFESNTLLAVDFVNHSAMTATHGWAVGSLGTVLHTTDGGSSWVRNVTPNSNLLRAVDFVDTLHGWVVGSQNTLWATSDGGSSWSVQTTGMDYNLFAVDFVDVNHGWIAGEQNVNKNPNGRVWRTRNGGQTWEEAGYFHAVDQGGHGKYGLDFVNQNIGYVVGMEVLNGSLHKTTNGGQSWTLLLSGTEYPDFYDVDFVNADVGWVVGDDGKIYHTSDGGNTWTAQSSGVTWALQDVEFISTSTGYVVGAGGVLVTTDGGRLWREDVSDYGAYSTAYQGVAFPNSFEIWTVGSNGTIGYLNRLPKSLDQQVFLPLVLR